MTRAGSPAAALTPDPGWTLGLLLELTISKLVQLLFLSLLLVVLCSSPLMSCSRFPVMVSGAMGALRC